MKRSSEIENITPILYSSYSPETSMIRVSILSTKGYKTKSLPQSAQNQLFTCLQWVGFPGGGNFGLNHGKVELGPGMWDLIKKSFVGTPGFNRFLSPLLTAKTTGAAPERLEAFDPKLGSSSLASFDACRK